MSASKRVETASDSSDLSSAISTLRWRENYPRSGVIALITILGTLWLLAGVWGVIGWLVVAVTWVLIPTIGAVAVGHIVVIALAPDGAGMTMVLPSLGAISGLLVVELAAESFGDAGIFTSLVIVTTAVTVVLAQVYNLLAATVVLITFVSSGSYVLHRYLLLELDLVEPGQSVSQTESDAGLSRTEQ